MDEKLIHDIIDRIKRLEAQIKFLSRLEFANTVESEAWIAPTLVNSWVNYGAGFHSAGYYKDPLGVVHIRGLIKDGTVTIGTTLFTLPVGYRPSQAVLFDVAGYIPPNPASVRIDVNASGTVTINSTADNYYLSLSGISFRAD